MSRLPLLLPVAALLFCLQSKAQTQSQQVKPDFKLFFEKTWLHTDREVYLPGDTLWFKAYLVNAQDNVPAFTSTNLHVELIGPGPKVFSSATVLLEKGSGHGEIVLADTIPAANYKLRAYTNWMLNFGDNFIFQKNIAVLTPAAGFATAASAVKTPATATAVATRQNVTSITPIVRFFPEGGQLVEGISALVAVKAENASGEGIKLSGAILSAGNDTVARFACDTLGMGLFALLPVKGQSYRAVIVQPNTKTVATINLPGALAHGFALQIRQGDSVLRAIVSYAGLPTETALPKYSIFVKHGGKTLINQQVQATGAQTAVAISTAGLPEGVASITVYNEQNKPECERLVYIHQPNAKTLKLSTSKPAYRTNEKATLQVDAGGAADLSIAVIDARAQSGEADNIVASLMLKSEVRGNIAHASHYFDPANASRFRQLDLLLMTQGWRSFVWRRLADTAIRISYTPETGLNIKGQVLALNSDVPLPNVNVSLYAPSARSGKLTAVATDAKGYFEFNNVAQFGNAGVVLTARDAAGKDAGRIKLDTLRRVPALPETDYSIKVDEGAYAVVKNLVQKQKQASGLINLKEVKVKSRRNGIQLRDMMVTSFGYKDEVLVPPADIATKFTVRDYILQASKQAQADNMASANVNSDGSSADADEVRFNRIVFFADGKVSDPRLIVNGYEVPVERGPESMKNALYSRYYDLPVTKAEKIVIKKMMTPPTIGTNNNFMNASGSMSASTVIMSHPIFIILLTLKPGAMETERPNVVPFALDGYYQARNFYTPANEAAAAKAGYRPTVYWSPNVKIDATGRATVSYFNSTPGPVNVVVQGIGTDGTPLSSVLSYSVQ